MYVYKFIRDTYRKPLRTFYIHLVDWRYCGIRQGMRTLYCNCSLEFWEILSQNLICYQRLIASGNSKIMHCGILNNTFYDDGSNKVWRAYKLTKILSLGLLHWQNSFVCKRKLNWLRYCTAQGKQTTNNKIKVKERKSRAGNWNVRPYSPDLHMIEKYKIYVHYPTCNILHQFHYWHISFQQSSKISIPINVFSSE